MTPHFEKLHQCLKRLPGLGYRSAERLALHLLVEKPERLPALVDALRGAGEHVRRCRECGNLCEDGLCAVCADPRRDTSHLCIVESVPDLLAIERSSAFRGVYHILHGKLSPINNVGPEQLNMDALESRCAAEDLREVTLAMSNDIEGEATCHYIQDTFLKGRDVRVTRIGFGLPSGGGIVFADATTLRSALEGRREY